MSSPSSTGQKEEEKEDGVGAGDREIQGVNWEDGWDDKERLAQGLEVSMKDSREGIPFHHFCLSSSV